MDPRNLKNGEKNRRAHPSKTFWGKTNGARITRTRDGLLIRLPDYTAPRIRLVLDPDEAEAWLTDLEQTA